MKTTISVEPNQQASELQMSYEGCAKLLTRVSSQQLAIEYYEPEVKIKINPLDGASSLLISYRYFAHHLAPSENRIFKYQGSAENWNTSLQLGIEQVIAELKVFQTGKTPDEKANADARYKIENYRECAKFLSMICEKGLAIEDYVPKIQVRPNEKTGHTSYSIAYQHKYFLTRKDMDRLFIIESNPESSNSSIEECMARVISQIMIAKS